MMSLTELRYEFSRYPKGMWSLAWVKFWERYAYYTILILLPLFLTGDKTEGGFGWENSDALKFTGAYFGIVFTATFFGGAITDRLFTLKKAIIFGLFVLMLGHIVMVMPHLTSFVTSHASGTDVASLIQGSELPLAIFYSASELQMLLVDSSASEIEWVLITQNTTAALFMLAIGLIAIGNAFFKPNITLAVGKQAYKSDAERDSAYILFYMIINLGAAASGILSGLIAETYGWHWGLSGAIVAITISLSLAVKSLKDVNSIEALAKEPFSDQKIQKDAHIRRPDSEFSKYAAVFLGIIFIFIFFYCVFFDQSAGLWALFIEQQMYREIHQFTVPTAWALSLNAIFVVLISPFLTLLWSRKRAFGAKPALFKFGFGFVLTGLSSALFWFVATTSSKSDPASILWVLPIFFLLTLGELFVGPIGESAISKHAPRKHQSLLMGSWFTVIGLGGFAAGQLGSTSDANGAEFVFAIIAIASMGCAFILFTSSAYLKNKAITD